MEVVFKRFVTKEKNRRKLSLNDIAQAAFQQKMAFVWKNTNEFDYIFRTYEKEFSKYASPKKGAEQIPGMIIA